MSQQTQTIIFDGPCAPRETLARIGVILLSSDENGGEAFFSIIPRDEALVFSTRAAWADESGGDHSLKGSLKDIADTLPPAGRFDVLAFSCTSATVEYGVENLLAQMETARPGLKYTSPAIAALAALRWLNVKKLALLTPYDLKTHNSFIPFLRDNGLEVVSDGTFNKQADAEIGELLPEAILEAAKTLVETSSPDGLFISCTATPVVPLIADLEKQLGVPVVTASQAMAWDALRLAGYRKPIDGFGRLLAAAR